MQSGWSRLWNSVAFWRGAGLLASGCAAGLLVAIAIRPPEIVHVPVERIVEVPARERPQSYVATLADKSGRIVLLAYAARNSNELWIKKSGVQEVDFSRQALELWGLPTGKGAAPRSLGVIPAGEKGIIKLAAVADHALKDFPALAISLEPKSGSAAGLPTGPVLYTGPCHRFW